MTSVLVIDDNDVDRERVRRLLRGAITMREAATGHEGLQSCAQEPPDCVLLDHRLPDVDGIDLIASLLEHGVALVMLSGQGSEQLAVTAIKRGAHDYLPKDSLSEEGLRTAVRHALHARDLQVQVQRQQAELARRAEELSQLRHVQKMEAIGQLAGGVAHDFNNLLTCIVGFTLFAQDGLPEGHGARQDLDEVLRAAERAAELTRQLLAVARRRPAEAQLVNPRVAIEGMLKMLGRLLGSTIDIKTRFVDEPWMVSIDPSWLEQILLNLTVNARDAMPQGGSLFLELQNADLDVPMSDAKGERAEVGRYVKLLIADTGMGMPPEVKDRIFDPFFTTKPVGAGTGLGLATVYGIVRQIGGIVQVYSEPGQGTAFRVLLPAAAPLQAVASPIAARVGGLSGTERVVVIEDDPPIRALTQRTLETAGYAVAVFKDGASGLAWIEAHPCDLVLTDVVTPGMNVTELVGRIGRLEVPRQVALMTGWSPYAVQAGSELAGLSILEKPFTPKGLLAFVREVLDGS